MVNEIRMVSIVARTNRMFFFIFSCWNLTRKSKLTWILRGPILFLHIVSYEFVNNNDNFSKHILYQRASSISF